MTQAEQEAGNGQPGARRHDGVHQRPADRQDGEAGHGHAHPDPVEQDADRHLNGQQREEEG